MDSSTSDEKPQLDATGTAIAPTDITIAVQDEGYLKKIFTISPRTNFKVLLDRYRAYVCNECSNPRVLDFWFEATKITDGHTARALGMNTGDIIDVRIAEACTRVACPLVCGQTLPNVHYLLEPALSLMYDGINEREEQPAGPERIKLRMINQDGLEMEFCVKLDSQLVHAMQTFAAWSRKEMHTVRFILDGERVRGDQTPRQLNQELEGGLVEGEAIEMFYESRSGGSLFANV